MERNREMKNPTNMYTAYCHISTKLALNFGKRIQMLLYIYAF